MKMKKTFQFFKTGLISLIVLFTIGFLAIEGCNKKETQVPKVTDFFYSGCNDVVLHADYLRDNDYPYTDTIYVTTVEGTKLKISTTNTPFSCGTDTVRPEINAQGQSVIIALRYEDPWSDCICGRHIDLTLDELTIGQTYAVTLKKNDDDYFQFEMTFGTDTNLMFVVEN